MTSGAGMEELRRQVLGILLGMWRRRWTGLAVAWAVAVIGATVLLRIPDRYEANAKVFVDTQTILKPLMAGLAVEPNLEQQVGMLSRTLLTRPNIEMLMRKTDLDLQNTSQRDRDVMIERLSRDIRIYGSGRENLFNLAYRDTSPERAKLVVQHLVSLFVESGLLGKKRDTEAARGFIDEQIRSYEKRLAEAENRLKEFKMRNLGYADGSGKDYFSRVTVLAEELIKLRTELRVAENTRDALKRELAGEDPVLLPETGPAASGSAGPSELDARIDSQKKLLDELLRRFTDEHPDVVATKRLIRQLEDEKNQEIEARRRAQEKKGTPRLSAATNPVFQQIRISLAEAEANVAALRTRASETQARLDQLKASAGRVPQVEVELAQLNRDYDIIRRNYDALVEKREQVSLSEEVDTSAGMVEFRVIEPPKALPRPVFPNRLALVPLVLLASIAAGAFVCFVLTQVFPTVDSTRMLRNLTQRPVLGAVTMVLSDPMRRRAYRQTILFACSLSALILTYAGWMVWVSLLSSRV